MRYLLISMLFIGCSPDVSPLPPNWIPLDDGGIVAIQPDGGLEPVLDAGPWLDAGIDLDAGWVDPGPLDGGSDGGESPLDAGADAGYNDPDAGTCKNGNGWGDKNHCHHH